MKYVLYIDYTSKYQIETGKGHEYLGMCAGTLEDAIEEADKKYDKETMYLIRIMKKEGKIEKMEDGWKKQRYTAILCNRGNGWHQNTEKYYESEHQVDRIETRGMHDYEIVAR